MRTLPSKAKQGTIDTTHGLKAKQATNNKPAARYIQRYQLKFCYPRILHGLLLSVSATQRKAHTICIMPVGQRHTYSIASVIVLQRNRLGGKCSRGIHDCRLLCGVHQYCLTTMTSACRSWRAKRNQHLCFNCHQQNIRAPHRVVLASAPAKAYLLCSHNACRRPSRPSHSLAFLYVTSS